MERIEIHQRRQVEFEGCMILARSKLGTVFAHDVLPTLDGGQMIVWFDRPDYRRDMIIDLSPVPTTCRSTYTHAWFRDGAPIRCERDPGHDGQHECADYDDPNNLSIVAWA